MSERGWGDPGWADDGARREPLPKLEDLPISEQGYDREAVREAFDAFYRHAAQLDSTLRVLESVEVFGRQARELRADIRSLRAASWGPAPSAQHVWSVGHETWAPQEPPAAFAASLPRLAVWAALIVAVGVGAALAELSTLLIVLLVLSAWALVALIEVALASRRAGALPVPLAPEPVGVAAPEPVAAAAAHETMIVPAAVEPEPEPAPEPELEPAAEPEPEPEPVQRLEPVAAVPLHAAAPVAAEQPEPDDARDAELAPEPVAAAPVEAALPIVNEEPVAGEDGHEPAPDEAAAEETSEPAVTPEQPKRRRFWQRRVEPVSEEIDDGGFTAPAPWRSEERVGDPWEDDAALDETGDPVAAAPPPSRGLLRRGRR